MMSLEISDIFKLNEAILNYSIEKLSELELTDKFIQRMYRQLDLTYLKQNLDDGSVCFSNSSEVQSSYKTTFTKTDVIGYLRAILNSKNEISKSDRVIFPKCKDSFYRLVLLMLPFLFFSLTSCNHDNQVESALVELFYKEKELNCQLDSMKAGIEMQWDSINMLLETNLPEDMPNEERNNILKVRNANLIRMFQSFNEVNENVKEALGRVERSDRETTERIITIKKEVNKVETEKLVLLNKTKQNFGTETVVRFEALRQSILSENCR